MAEEIVYAECILRSEEYNRSEGYVDNMNLIVSLSSFSVRSLALITWRSFVTRELETTRNKTY